MHMLTTFWQECHVFAELTGWWQSAWQESSRIQAQKTQSLPECHMLSCMPASSWNILMMQVP